MAYSTIRYDVADGIAVITLHRPDRLNAFTPDMRLDLLAAFDEVDADDAVRVVIVTGEGRAFCAGADLAGGTSSFDHGDQTSALQPDPDSGGLVTLRIFRCLKPVIAAINGPAVGIGATMTLPMDVRLASDTARIGFVFGGRGIVPDGASSWFLPRVVGISQALEWCMTARVFSAREALAGGLVRSVHPRDDLLGAAQALAAEMAATVAPVSAAITRQLLWRMMSADHPMDAHRVESLAIAQTGRLADAAEGITAFLEKRPPQWSLKPSRDLPDWYPWWQEPTYERG
jgi:enoyl-CoA hydratase/carnithine racemase